MKTSKARQIEAVTLRNQGWAAFISLGEMAKTDEHAAGLFVNVLFELVKGMNRDMLSNAKHPLRKIARVAPQWLGLVSPDKEVQAAQFAFARQIELGCDGPLNFTGRKWSRTTPGTRAAVWLFEWIRRRGDKMPPLTRNTAKKWYDHAKDSIPEMFGENYETHQLFKPYDTPTHRNCAANKGQSWRAWHRDQIRDGIAKGFLAIARKS